MPSTPTTSAVGPSGTNPGATRRPTATWTYTDADGVPQSQVQVQVKRSSDNVVVFDSGVIQQTGLSYAITASLGDLSYYMSVRTGKNVAGVDYWSAYANGSAFTIAAAPQTPTNVTPASGATVTTDVPTLGATVLPSATVLAFPANVKAEWQIALDSGFTTQLKTITEDPADLRTTGATTEVVSVANQLHQGAGVPQIWYIRARTIDEYGTASGYSVATTFTVSHPPTTSVISPSGGSVVNWNGGQVGLSFLFADPSSTDVLSAYQVIIERNDTGATALDTGKLTTGYFQGPVNISPTISSSTFKDVPLRWKVRAWDSDDVVGAYSSYGLFSMGDLPTTAITAPVTGGTVSSGSPAVTWTFTGFNGRTQAKYRVTYKLGTTVLLDTGWVTSTATTYTPTATLYSNGQVGTITVEVEDTSGYRSVATNSTFTTTFTVPASPTLSVDGSNYDVTGALRITWYGNILSYNQASAETDTTGMVVDSGTATLARVTSASLDGAASWQVTVSAPGTNGVSLRITPPIAWLTNGDTPLVPGDTYTFSIWVKFTSATARNMMVHLNYGSNGASSDFPTLGTQYVTSTSAWTEVKISGVVPSVANPSAHLLIWIPGALAGDVVLIDKLTFARGSAPPFMLRDPTFTKWRLYRRKVGVTAWTLLGETRAEVTDFYDYSAAANTAYEYSAVQVATRTGGTVESPQTATAYTSTGTDYWLLHPTLPTLNVRLPIVVSDSYSDEYEKETLLLIGRGRKVDYGTHYGVAGSLECRVYDDSVSGLTARQLRTKIEALRALEIPLYLRNPFGDLWQVMPIDISVSRIAGVGTREFCTVTVPYQEVA